VQREALGWKEDHTKREEAELGHPSKPRPGGSFVPLFHRRRRQASSPSTNPICPR
jgi:hypothetical protein